MKAKSIILILLISFTPLLGHAQTTFGVIAAGGVSEQKGNPELSLKPQEEFSPGFTFSFGAYSNTQLSKKFSLNFNLLFSSKSSFEQFPDSIPYFRLKYKIQYVELPIILHYEIFKGIKVGAGFHQGIKLFNWLHETESQQCLMSKDFSKNYDYGYLADIQVKVFKKITAGGRFQQSLSYWNNGSYLPHLKAFRHRSFLLYLQYEFSK
jgi:hypothetical protein